MKDVVFYTTFDIFALMGAVSSMADFTSKKYESFHRKLKGFCSSRKQFENNIDVDMRHITREGIKKNPQRLALGKEQIAAVILQGSINLACSSVGQGSAPMELVIEGKILDFEWFDHVAMKSKTEVFA